MKNFLFGLLLIPLAFIRASEPPLTLLTASYFGTAEDDDIEGAAQAGDGTVYLVGNTGAGAKDLPMGVSATVFGKSVAAPRCGRGFVAHFSGDLGKLLDYSELADGVAILTSVEIGNSSVYASGYATEGLEPLLNGKPGLLKRYPLATEAELVKEGKDVDPIGLRPGLGRFGAPFVVRLSPNLKELSAGTYLEGWQQVWDKFRVKTIRPRSVFPAEYFWQPASLGLLKSGDLIVSHDGGYFRPLTDKDEKIAAGNKDLLDRLSFYDICDWVSRLSPDLASRTWKQPIYTPKVNLDTARSLKGAGWPVPHYGNPRTLRMRLDANDNIFLCGWSASYTALEPWWSPFLWKLDPGTGLPVWKAFDYDPMSGRDHRLNGTVSDTAVGSLAVDGDGNLLVSLYGDGGDSIIDWSPKGELGLKFEGQISGTAANVKLVHWWGAIDRVNTKTSEGMGATHFASRNKGVAGPAWVVDLASSPGNQVLALGRCNFDFPWSDNAWARGDPDENPTGFLRLYSPTFDLLFSTALPGVIPFEIVPLSGNRYLIVGQSKNGTAPTLNALYSEPQGKADGYYCVVQLAPAIEKK